MNKVKGGFPSPAHFIYWSL